MRKIFGGKRSSIFSGVSKSTNCAIVVRHGSHPDGQAAVFIKDRLLADYLRNKYPHWLPFSLAREATVEDVLYLTLDSFRSDLYKISSDSSLSEPNADGKCAFTSTKRQRGTCWFHPEVLSFVDTEESIMKPKDFYKEEK